MPDADERKSFTPGHAIEDKNERTLEPKKKHHSLEFNAEIHFIKHELTDPKEWGYMKFTPEVGVIACGGGIKHEFGNKKSPEECRAEFKKRLTEFAKQLTNLKKVLSLVERARKILSPQDVALDNAKEIIRDLRNGDWEKFEMHFPTDPLDIEVTGRGGLEQGFETKLKLIEVKHTNTGLGGSVELHGPEYDAKDPENKFKWISLECGLQQKVELVDEIELGNGFVWILPAIQVELTLSVEPDWARIGETLAEKIPQVVEEVGAWVFETEAVGVTLEVTIPLSLVAAYAVALYASYKTIKEGEDCARLKDEVLPTVDKMADGFRKGLLTSTSDVGREEPPKDTPEHWGFDRGHELRNKVIKEVQRRLSDRQSQRLPGTHNARTDAGEVESEVDHYLQDNDNAKAEELRADAWDKLMPKARELVWASFAKSEKRRFSTLLAAWDTVFGEYPRGKKAKDLFLEVGAKKHDVETKIPSS